MNKKCINCERNFVPLPHNAGKYCSRNCYYEQMKIVRKGICFNTGRTHFKKGIKPKVMFEKGMIPWNKGTRGIMIKSESAYSFPKGDKHPNWKGGKFIQNGYVFIMQKKHIKKFHPHSKEVYIARYRYIIEKQLGRPLKSTEVVHHINEKTTDDRIKNLMVFKCAGAHSKFHKDKNSKYGLIFNGSNI
jgi:hypothetical protein